jgi:hypothetical protein
LFTKGVAVSNAGFRLRTRLLAIFLHRQVHGRPVPGNAEEKH